MTKTVLIVGATGLFGGHLARQLIVSGKFNVVCSGRNRRALDVFCKEHGGTPLSFDRTDMSSTKDVLESHMPFAVIDVAGPFQEYGDDPYAFARACIDARAHYIDIADAPEFVKGISSLDELAKQNGVTVLSGASSTPALSSAVIDSMVVGMDEIFSIETTIAPGNRTPRGISVMRAILGQVGQKFKVFKNGSWETVRGWDDTTRIDLRVEGTKPIIGRLASLVNTPDVLLFPDRYLAQTVLARAGLELGLFHHSLRIARYLVQWKLLRSLVGFSGIAHRVASWFQNIGSDAGGMKVVVVGRTFDGVMQERSWCLIASDGHGPKIPVQPIAVALDKILHGELTAGARPCVGEITLDELEQAMAEFGAVSSRESRNI